ncbi:MAG: DUF4136 domain-containing protein [Verrucomicrobiota bacterium]
MKSQLLTFSLFAASLLISACSTITVRSDFDPKANFSALRTYAWMPLPPNNTGDPRVDNPLVEKRIMDAIDSQLAAKGFQKTSSGSADFLVGYAVAVNREMRAHVIDNYYAYPYPYYRAGRYGYPWITAYPQPQVRVYEYDQGTLVIDILNAKDKGLIFRGSAQAALRENPTPTQSSQRINEAVSKILAKFPPS